jgi:PTH1 family peptidyl-tRNA hydrolase
VESNKILFAGLGNPGRKYLNTRHNIGFMVLDLYAERESFTFSETSKPCAFAFSSKKIKGLHVFLQKPLTYMNRSGEAVSYLARYYKIPFSNVLAVHDDLDISLGCMKFARGGGSGGHKGIRSIMEKTGGAEFPRLKLGIGRPEKIPAEKYVLSPFKMEEKGIVERLLGVACDGLDCFLEEGIEAAMNNFNGIRIEPNGV